MTERGFPDGARWTPVPDLFMSRYVPEMASPVAIKVALHVLWRVHRRPSGRPPAVRLQDLVADQVLRSGLRALGVDEAATAEAVTDAIEALVADGLLLMARAPNRGGPVAWLFVNCREGRTAFGRWRDDGLVLPDLPAASDSGGGPRPNIFALYEENIGLLTPLLAEELRDAEATYPAAWIEDAFRIAVSHNARRWAYVRAILERWAREGKDDEADRRSDQVARERDIEGPYGPFIER